MRYKVVPDPAAGADLESVQRAVPLVPDSVEDCCTRIRDGTDLASRDAAREWLTFLEALELVEETPRGYRRLRRDPDSEAVAEAFEAQVFGAAEVLAALEDGPKTPPEAFEAIRSIVPEWERDRHTDWAHEWQDRTRYLLEWAVVFGQATREDDVYRRVD